MPQVRQVDEFVKNLYETEWIPLLPGIRGKCGVVGTPTGMNITDKLGIDLIDMDPSTSFPLHTHPGSHILFVLEGKGTVTIGDTCYETKAGDCYFVPANFSHGVGAIENHKLLSIGFPHVALTDPKRMDIVDQVYLQEEPLFAQIYSDETNETKRQELLKLFQQGKLNANNEEVEHE